MSESLLAEKRLVALPIESDESWQDPEVPAYGDPAGDPRLTQPSRRWPYDTAAGDPFTEHAERI